MCLTLPPSPLYPHHKHIYGSRVGMFDPPPLSRITVHQPNFSLALRLNFEDAINSQEIFFKTFKLTVLRLNPKLKHLILFNKKITFNNYSLMQLDSIAR